MSELYYTPTIDEFHVGFEYQFLEKRTIHSEFLTENKWIGKILGKEDLGYIDDLLNGRIGYPENIRVPFLTKESIEEKGWKDMGCPGSNNQGITHLYFNGLFPTTREKQPVKYRLIYVLPTRWIVISDSDDNTRFSGHIKNKSELSKLLKQLEL